MVINTFRRSGQGFLRVVPLVKDTNINYIRLLTYSNHTPSKTIDREQSS